MTSALGAALEPRRGGEGVGLQRHKREEVGESAAPNATQPLPPAITGTTLASMTDLIADKITQMYKKYARGVAET